MEPKWQDDIRQMMSQYEQETPCADPSALLKRMEQAAASARRRGLAALWAQRIAAAAAVAAIALPASRTIMPCIPQAGSEPATAMAVAQAAAVTTPVGPHTATSSTTAAPHGPEPAPHGPEPTVQEKAHGKPETADRQAGNGTGGTQEATRHAPSGSVPQGNRLATIRETSRKHSRPMLASLSVTGALSANTPAATSATAMLSKANPIGQYTSTFGSDGSKPLMAHSNPTNTKTHHSQPLRLALTMAYPINRRWAVEAGVAYSYLHSETTTNGTGYSTATDQRLHYIGIPVAVSYTAWRTRRFSLYAKAGAMAEKMVSGRAETVTTVGSDSRAGGSHSVAIGPLQLSATAAIGAEWHFSSNIGAYAEPGVTCHFDNGSGVSTFYSENPVAFSLTLGLRFNIAR